MTREEAKAVFLNRGYVEVEGGTIYDANKWRESCRVISEWLEQEPCEDAISREDVINLKWRGEASEEFLEGYANAIEDARVLPSVKPQEPTITSTEDSAEMTYPQVEGITPTIVEPIGDDYKYIKSISKPTGVEFDIDIDKKVESYGKLLKHPVIKHIMDMDETQEELDFVQPHKQIPVTLTVQKEKTCDGCLFQQYPRITVCQECSRYYSDNYVKE